MKTCLLLFTICIITNTTKAQFATFAPIGAEMWIVENNANGAPMAYYLFDVTKDTTIASVVYNKLVRNRIQEVMVMDTTIKNIGYFNQNDGVITCYDTLSNEILPYFNLNAMLGDTLSTPVYYGTPNPDYAKFRKMVVDSIGDTLISGVILKKYWMDFLPYECIDEFAFFWNSGVFIEGIGFLGYPLQWFNAGGYDGEYPSQLRCYQDTALGLVKFVDEACDYLMTNIETLDATTINIYPNPARDVLYIQLNQSVEINHIALIDINGIYCELCYPNSNDTNMLIPIQNLLPGIYTLVIYNNKNSYITSQIIKL